MEGTLKISLMFIAARKFIVFRLSIFVILSFVLVWHCRAQGSDSGKDVALKLDEYVESLNKLGPFSGSILIAKDGQVLASRGYGMADLEHSVANTDETKFRLASI